MNRFLSGVGALLSVSLLAAGASARPPGGHASGGRPGGGGRPSGGFRPPVHTTGGFRVAPPATFRPVTGTTPGGTGFYRSFYRYPSQRRNLFFFSVGSPLGVYAAQPALYGYGLAYAAGGTAPVYAPAYSVPESPGERPPLPQGETLDRALDFGVKGEQDFNSGLYDAAAKNWRHSLVDDPRNAGVVLLLAQALFQQREYPEAAGAVQHGLASLPESQWGVVVGNYTKLYRNVQDYTDALRALEAARNKKPDDPSLRFLLGYHYAFLGYPKEAVRELDELLKLAPRDEIAKKLRDAMAAKLKNPE